jgi:hypothetical protein
MDRSRKLKQKTEKEMPPREIDELAESLLMYRGQIKTIEDAIRIVAFYLGTPEDLGHTRHAIIAEALFRKVRFGSAPVSNSAPVADIGRGVYRAPRR